MGKTKERAWRNTFTHPLNKMLKPTQKISYTMGKKKEHTCRNTNTPVPTKKLQPMRKLLDDGGDVEAFDPRQEHCELVEIVSSDSVLAEAVDSGKEMNVIDDSPEWAQALEPVRKLPTNVGARIKRCIYASLNENPLEWAKEILENSISNKVYKGNASGPTKRAVISVLEKLRVNDIPQPKPTEKKEKEKNGARTLYEGEISYTMGKKKEHACRNTNTQIPKKKLQPMRKLLDDGGDVEPFDPRQEHCELVEIVSSDSSLDDDDDDDGDGDVEVLEPVQDQSELDENVSPMSDSQGKDSSCQSGMVYVQGYKVKRSIATILEAVFKKHGDIAANCVFKTSSTRTHFLEVVCEVVRQIQTNDMTEMVKDIEGQLSDAEAANINVSWIRAHFEALHQRKETSKNYSLLMEMKSNASLVKRAAQVDLRERCEELMSAQERFNNAERCVRVLHLVEKNLNDNILESKAELDSCVNHPLV